MLLTDEHACVVNALGEAQLEHLRLQTALEEVLYFETKYVIELHAVLCQHANAHQATQQRVTCVGTMHASLVSHWNAPSKFDTLEQAARILLVACQQLTCCFAHLGQRQLDSPYFALVAQTVLADKLQLLHSTKPILSIYNYYCNIRRQP